MGSDLCTAKVSSTLSLSRLALGSAQFGLNYGIANQTGQVCLSGAAAILGAAELAGFNTLDTAIAYGDSEERLGKIGVKRWQIVSKLPRLPDMLPDVGAWVRTSVLGSLERLNVPSLHGLLLHHPADLVGPQGTALQIAIKELKALGLVRKIGISVYDPEELTTLLKLMSVDIVQAPFNILDRRLIHSGWLGKLQELRIEIHTRSVFMQGLLLMPQQLRPARFHKWQTLWDEWECWLNVHKLTPIQACMRYALSFDEIKRIIVGVDTPIQLGEIIAAASGEVPPVPYGLQTTDVTLLNPSHWPKE